MKSRLRLREEPFWEACSDGVKIFSIQGFCQTLRIAELRLETGRRPTHKLVSCLTVELERRCMADKGPAILQVEKIPTANLLDVKQVNTVLLSFQDIEQ